MVKAAVYLVGQKTWGPHGTRFPTGSRTLDVFFPVIPWELVKIKVEGKVQ